MPLACKLCLQTGPEQGRFHSKSLKKNQLFLEEPMGNSSKMLWFHKSKYSVLDSELQKLLFPDKVPSEQASGQPSTGLSLSMVPSVQQHFSIAVVSLKGTKW